MLKTLPSQLAALLRSRKTSRRNLRLVLQFLLVLGVLIVVYTVAFHFLMLREGKEYSWITGLYWTLTVMSTLGFGDITFDSDLGRAFSLVVLLSGIVFLLVLLPFTFIEFFYEPWVRAQAAARTPRRVPPETHGHVILTHYDKVTAALIRRIESYRADYVLVAETIEKAQQLLDMGLKVVVGNLNDPDTYQRVNADRAAMVATTAADVTNTAVAFTVREVAPQVPIVATAKSEVSVDILELAGSDHVLRLDEIVGEWFSRRLVGGERASHVIDHIDGILVAEAPAYGTPLVGKTLAEAELRKRLGVVVAGVHQRGRFEAARPETKIESSSQLVLVGSKEALARFDESYGFFLREPKPVIIIGGGRVGRATARAIARRGYDYRIVEKLDSRGADSDRQVIGDAADLHVLQRAGIDDAMSILITPRDDDLNTYLTLYVSRLRPDAQVIARTSDERHVSALHRAGADFVISYATTGANAIFNFLEKKQLLIQEGLEFFRVPVPSALAGISLAESDIRQRTGCYVVAASQDGSMQPISDSAFVLPEGAEILLVGSVEAQEKFLALFGEESMPSVSAEESATDQ